MNESNNYVLKRETVLFLPKYNESGHLSTVIMENSTQFEEELGPTALMDYNLGYYGSSLRGACDGSKKILGKINMNPIVINETLDIYWFPSMSSTREDCIWFALHHIKDSKAVGKKKTEVLLSNGSTVIVDVSAKTFENKMQMAYKLKYKLEGRTKQIFMMTRDSSTIFHITKKKDERNYKLVIKD